jgi:type IV pilus assembly protein PilA
MGSGDWYHARGGQHVGPVSLAELTRRIGAGEVGSDDLVWREGMPDWQPARTVSELAGALPAGPAAAPLPGSSPSAPAQPAWAPGGFDPSAPLSQQQAWDPAGAAAPMLGYGGYTPPKPGASGLAIAAFVLSLAALFVGMILALPALVMGIIAVYDAKRTGRRKGLAVAAVVISGIDVLLGGGLIVYVLLRR